MNIVLFFVILVALVVVHELGHFAVAKCFGIRVDEFGFGFPPKLWGKKVGETEYTLNALPFGGFVRIFGENAEEIERSRESSERSFVGKPKLVQAAVLVAGVVMNMLFAWLLFTAGFVIGMPVSSSYDGFGTVENIHTEVLRVVPGSPAATAGLEEGDILTALSAGKAAAAELSPETVQTFIAAHGSENLRVSYTRKSASGEALLQPKEGIVEGRAAIGIEMDAVGTAVMPLYETPLAGASLAWNALIQIATGLASFFGTLFIGHANFAEVTGPVGLVGVVGSAAAFGLVPLLSLIALISLNLALINLIPFPALDGGRLLFVAIEAMKGTPIRASVANTANMIGFGLLILLMLVVTFHDIARLFV